MKYLTPNTLVVFALKSEIMPFFKEIKIQNEWRLADIPLLYQADIKGIPLFLLKTGVGSSNVEKAFTLLPTFLDISKIINIGTCGTLTQQVTLYDTVFPEKFISRKDSKAFFLQQCPKDAACGLTCLTLDKFLKAGDFSSELFQKRYSADLLDMEAWDVVKWAKKKSLDVLVIKCVSDLVGVNFHKTVKKNIPLCAHHLAQVLLS